MSDTSTTLEPGEVYEHPEHGRVRLVELPEDDPESAWVFPIDSKKEWEISVSRSSLDRAKVEDNAG